MARFVGIKNNNICIVADSHFNENGIKVLQVPPELEGISSADLIINTKVRNGIFKYKLSKKTAKQLKIAFVGNWKMKCGIATYSENLWPEVAKQVGDFKLFIEKNDEITTDIHQFGSLSLPDNQICSCWKRGESLQQLVKEIKEYDPDVIIIQHEFGLWPNAAYWLSMMTQLLDYRVIVVMHSVFPYHQDKTIVEASMPEIVVHLEGAREALKNKGISNLIHVIPHGCYDISDNYLWNFYKSDHTIVQMGFGFKYKSFESAIIACSFLKEKYSDIFLTILFSESEYNKLGHSIYFNELYSLIEELDMQEHVSIIRGFQSDNVVDSFLRTNKVAVFPYKSDPGHLVFGASGAARLAMAANVPVITSNIPHFSDLPTIKCDTPEQISNQLDILFSNKAASNFQIEKQKNFIQENSWANIALKYVSILENK